MTLAWLERLAQRLFPYRWGLAALSLAGAAALLALARAGKLAFWLVPVLLGSWWLFCACVWFHPTRGTMRPSAIPWRWLPGWAGSLARAWAAFVLMFAAAVTLFTAAQMAKPARGDAGACSSHSVYEALARDSFSPIRRVADIPPAVITEFWRAYGAGDRDHRIADPGEPFQSTDVVDVDMPLPWRRLLFGGASARIVYLYYEKGGLGLSRHLFVSCLGSPSSPAFSYVAAPWVASDRGFAGAFNEKCLFSPPRERFALEDRGTCY